MEDFHVHMFFKVSIGNYVGQKSVRNCSGIVYIDFFLHLFFYFFKLEFKFRWKLFSLIRQNVERIYKN